MIKLPDSIPILGRNITIRMVSERPLNKDGDELDGHYYHPTRSIDIFDGLSDEDTVDTLFHEAGHAYLTFLGWDQELNDREQELLCQMLSLFTVDMIKGLKL